MKHWSVVFIVRSQDNSFLQYFKTFNRVLDKLDKSQNDIALLLPPQISNFDSTANFLIVKSTVKGGLSGRIT